MTLLNLFAILLVLTSVVYVIVKYTMPFDLKGFFIKGTLSAKNIDIIIGKKTVIEVLSYVFIVVGLAHILLTSSGNKVVGAKTTVNLVLFGVLCLIILGLGILSIVMATQIKPEFDNLNKSMVDLEEQKIFDEAKGNTDNVRLIDEAEEKINKYENELHGIIVNGIIVGCSGILYSLLLMYVKCGSIKLA